MSAVADRLPAPVLLLGADTTLQYMNPAAANALNETLDRLIGRRMLDLIHPDDRPRAALAFSDVAAGLVPGGVANYRVRANPTDPWRTFEIVADNLLDDPDVAGILLSGRDVTDQLTHEANLYVAAYRDPLTGLPNRSEIDQQLGALVAQGEPLAVAFIGLDRFKLINDSLGHTAGDDVLRVVSSRLAESLPSAAVVGRFGADVFVALIPGSAAAQARSLVWRAVEDEVVGKSLLGLVTVEDVEGLLAADRVVTDEFSVACSVHMRDGSGAWRPLWSVAPAVLRTHRGHRVAEPLLHPDPP